MRVVMNVLFLKYFIERCYNLLSFCSAGNE